IWAPDGRSIYFGCKQAVYTNLCSVTTGGQFRIAVQGAYNIGAVSPSPDGKTVLFVSEDAKGGTALRQVNTDGSGNRVLLDLTPPIKHRFRLGEVREIQWKASDGLVSHGLLILPPDYQPGRKYPLLVNLHGGPVGG